jgi:hypothetical protein
MAMSTKEFLVHILFNVLFLDHKDHKAYKEFKGYKESKEKQGRLELRVEFGDLARVFLVMA